MTNEEKLREALLRLMDRDPRDTGAWRQAEQAIKETEPPKPEHPAIKAFYDWYVGDGEDEEPEKLTGIDKVLLERRRETFLAGYKAGVKSIATHIAKHGGEWIWMSDVDKIANEVPTV